MIRTTPTTISPTTIRCGPSSIREDHAGSQLAERWNLIDNFMWANDYPHAEGNRGPHSAEAIEREMGHLSDEARAKILGLNAVDQGLGP